MRFSTTSCRRAAFIADAPLRAAGALTPDAEPSPAAANSHAGACLAGAMEPVGCDVVCGCAAAVVGDGPLLPVAAASQAGTGRAAMLHHTIKNFLKVAKTPW